MASTLRSKATQALVERICQDFDVDPREVTNITMEDGHIYFERHPLVFDLPDGYQVSATVTE